MMKTIAWRNRAPKENPQVRCCWVCGKTGGFGFTTTLRLAGYRMAQNQMGYAHNKCMMLANQQHKEYLSKRPE